MSGMLPDPIHRTPQPLLQATPPSALSAHSPLSFLPEYLIDNGRFCRLDWNGCGNISVSKMFYRSHSSR